MTLVHTLLAWGGIVGVLGLGCFVGCSVKQEPVPRPPIPRAPQETAPTPVPHVPPPQAKTTTPAGQPTITQVGTASWYGPGFHGRATASGETFNQHALTAAHRTLPLGTEATVTNLATGQSVQVKINDRGPYVPGRHLDLSQAAAKKIGLTRKGVAKVKIEAKPRGQRLHQDAQPRGTASAW
jgi:rare lipoprotein A (peptidoglycan hydrolase)